MKKKSITFYSIFIILVFVFAIGFFAYNILVEVNASSIRIAKTFDFLCEKIKNASDDNDFQNIVDENNSDLCALCISKNEKIIFAFPNHNALNAESSKFVRVYKKSVAIPNLSSESYNVVASLYSLRPSTIFYCARFSFILITIATLWTIILIIYYSITGKSIAQEIKTEIDDTTANESPLDIPENDETLPNNENPQDEQDDNDSQEQNDNNQGYNDGYQESNDDSAGVVSSTHYTSLVVEDSPNDQQNGSDDENDASISEIKENFSTRTGMSLQSQLNKRLDAELVRAASSLQDLSLFIIKIENMTFDDENAKLVADCLLEEFQTRNNIFEYQTNSFAVIKMDATIDDAEKQAEDLYLKISDVFKNAESENNEGDDNSEDDIYNDSEKIVCHIGLSARSERLLSATRLITEATEALAHAEDEKSKIVAFHVDLNKYREYVNERE